MNRTSLKKSTTFAAACAAVLLMSGCETLDALNFKEAKDSGQAQGSLAVFPTSDTIDAQVRKELPDLIPVLEAAPGWEQRLQGNCDRDDKALQVDAAAQKQAKQADATMKATGAAVAAPVVAAIFELGFNLLADRQQHAIEQIVARSQKGYAATLQLGAVDFFSRRCLVVVRYKPAKDSAKAELLSLLLLQLTAPRSDSKVDGDLKAAAFVARAVYARVWQSVALTRQDAEPTIDLSIALSVKALGIDKASGMPQLLPAGAGVSQVAGLVLGKAGKPKCTDGPGCRPSDQIVVPLSRGTVSLTVAVVEQGDTGFDDKAALADLAAIKAAIGPAIGEAVKARLDP